MKLLELLVRYFIINFCTIALLGVITSYFELGITAWIGTSLLAVLAICQAWLLPAAERFVKEAMKE